MGDIDMAAMSQTQLLQLVNATPLGTVLTRSRLRRQMDVAAHRFGDGKRIHLLKYIRWLALEVDRPRTGPMDYTEARDRQAKRNRMATRASQDVAPIPPIVNIRRRRSTEKNLRVFCEKYFAKTFCWKWSRDHLKVIAKIESAVLDGGLFAFAMPRGSGKTCMARTAALWAVLHGHRSFVCLIGGSDNRAKKQLLLPLKTAILENALLMADFPEAIHPLRALGNTAKRQAQQHANGQLTHVRWDPDMIVFPTLGEADIPKGLDAMPSTGAVIAVTSLDSNLRGPNHARPDGSVIRPSLVLLDDPQTRASARSPGQTKTRMDLLYGDVLRMAGPGVGISGLITCTKMYADDLADQVLNQEDHPDWQGECTKLIYEFPTDWQISQGKTKWIGAGTSPNHWERYSRLRAEGLRSGRQLGPCTAYYKRHRKPMDAGARIAWPERYDRGKEISPVQHAMDQLLLDEETFWAECQNEPRGEQQEDDVLTTSQVMERTNGRNRGLVPQACEHLTGFIDIHDRLLFWMVCAWQADFTGYVVDYGTWPKQTRSYFSLRKAPRTMQWLYEGRGVDAAILAGIKDLANDLLLRGWETSTGGHVRMDRLLADKGYKPKLAGAAQHSIPGSAMVLSLGRGIGARNIPMTQYRRKPGEKYGHHWYMPNVVGTHEFPHVAMDVNYWKSFVHRALLTPAGDPGCLTLFGRKAKAHELLAEHIAGAETWVQTIGRGRTVHEWKIRPAKPDNHWLDCLVGCAAAAAMLGATTPGMDAKSARPRKRYTQDDLRRHG